MKFNRFGKKLRACRIAARYGLREFAEVVGIDFSNYSKIERGILKPPTGNKLSKILSALALKGIEAVEELWGLSLLGRADPEIVKIIDSLNDENISLRKALKKLEDNHGSSQCIVEKPQAN